MFNHLASRLMFRQGLLATIAASGLVGCGGEPHTLPPDIVAGGGSEIAQPLSSSVSLSGSGVAGGGPDPAQPLSSSNLGRGITEYLLPTPKAMPFGITVGADGNIWFTETNSNKVAKITAAGKISEYSIPTPGTPGYIIAGPGGNLWFTEHFAPSNGSVETASVIDEITVNGKIVKQYNVPTFAGLISGLAQGPDGNVWFTDPIGNTVEKLTPAGAVTTYPLANGTGPGNIAPGPGGDLWFTENLWSGRVGSSIAKITIAGIVSEYPLATSAGPNGVAATRAANLWFTEAGVNKIGKVSTVNTVTSVPATEGITEYPVPTAKASLFDITESPDGNHWFTEYSGNKIGRITAAGTITEYPLPTAGALPEDITAQPNGTVWFTEAGADKIGKISSASP